MRAAVLSGQIFIYSFRAGFSCPDDQIVSSYPAYVAKPPEFSYESGIYDEALSLRLSANTSGIPWTGANRMRTA